MTESIVADPRWMWSAEAPNPLDPKGKWKIVDPDGGVIARLEVHPNSDEEAPIIAAAPDLLAALKEMLRLHCDTEHSVCHLATHFNTRAAIAKAEGR